MLSDPRAPLPHVTWVIAHDSGAKPGYAVFDRGTHNGVWVLQWCGVQFSRVLHGPAVLVSELPEYRKHDKVNPNNTIQLAWTGGGQAGEIAAVRLALGIGDTYRVTVKPSGWKGSVDKPTHHARLRKRLTAAELKLLEGQPPDVWDACALGIWYVGRW